MGFLSRNLVGVVATVGAIGCAGDVDRVAGSTAGSGAGTNDVTGTMIDTYVTETGDVEVPSHAELSAFRLLSDGSDEPIVTTTNPDGSFVFHDVPEGDYFIRIDRDLIRTSERVLDLGTIQFGRPDAMSCCDNASLEMSFGGLDPWASGDSIQLYSLGANINAEFFRSADIPADGATSVENVTAHPNDLTKLTAEDHASLTQLTFHFDEPTFYASVARSLDPGPVSFIDGEATTVSGTFGDVAQENIELDWDLEAFAKLAEQGNPSAADLSQYFEILANPGGSRRSRPVDPAEVFQPTAPLLVASGDTMFEHAVVSAHFGDPYDATWARLGEVVASYQVDYDDPTTGAPFPWGFFVSTGHVAPLEELAKAPLTPRLGPPLGLTLDGEPAYGQLEGVGSEPKLSWSPPTLGQPDVYLVSIAEIPLDPAQSGSLVATLQTSGTEWQFPKNTLTSGKWYSAKVSAQTGIDPRAPRKRPAEYAFAEALSGLFAP